MQETLASVLRRIAPRLLRIVKAVSRIEKSALLALACVAGALFVFAELSDAVSEGETRQFDEYVLRLLRTDGALHDPIGPRWFELMVGDFTALGGIGVLTALTLAVIGFLVLVRKHHLALLLAVSVGGGTLLSSIFKWVFARPRPDLVPHLSEVSSMSFPSGHAMLAAVVYLTIGVLLARAYADVRVKLYLLTIAALITIVVGLSRIYLGVHWPTDVLAGWAVGAAWALFCWLVMLWLQSHGRVEPEGNGAAPPHRQ